MVKRGLAFPFFVNFSWAKALQGLPGPFIKIYSLSTNSAQSGSCYIFRAWLLHTRDQGVFFHMELLSLSTNSAQSGSCYIFRAWLLHTRDQGVFFHMELLSLSINSAQSGSCYIFRAWLLHTRDQGVFFHMELLFPCPLDTQSAAHQGYTLNLK